MRIKPLRALLPPRELAADLASVPYDVVSREEARQLVERKPWSFLHIVRPDVNLPAGTDIYSDVVYQAAKEQLGRFVGQGALVRDKKPGLFVYRLRMGNHAQHGIVACCHTGDVEQGVIRKHETTREDKLADRIRIIDTLDAHSGPVFMVYRDSARVEELMAASEKEEPLFDFAGHYDIQHTMWRATEPEKLVEEFGAVPACYIADGHHRVAAAVEVARRRGDRSPEAAWFLSVLFPASHVCILPYNRCVRDLRGMSTDDFLAACAEHFCIIPDASDKPSCSGEMSMYLQGRWYGLRAKDRDDTAGLDPVARLDVSVLQEGILGPILGIDDPRRDTRVDFIGGIRGTDELARRVDSGEAAVAFSLYPVTVEQIMDIADAGLIMPPKSTWFEPKLKSGLVVHTF